MGVAAVNDLAYIFFGIWPEARLWAREFRIPFDDIIMAAQPTSKVRRRVGDRRVVFVQSGSHPIGAGTIEAWKSNAAWGREHNEKHDWYTEVREI